MIPSDLDRFSVRELRRMARHKRSQYPIEWLLDAISARYDAERAALRGAP